MSDHDEQKRLPALQQLALRNQWLVWKFRGIVGSGKKARKIPINPFNGEDGSSSDHTKWSSYEFASNFYETFKDDLAGLGYAFTDDDPEYGVTSDNVTGVDIDGCVNKETREIDEWILPLLSETYCEITPSGKGLHFLVEGKWDLGGKKARIFRGARVEIYRGRRYFSITGDHVAGSSDYINPAPILMAALFRRGEEMATDKERQEWDIEAEFAEKVEGNDPPKPKADVTEREREYAREALTKAAGEVSSAIEMRNDLLNKKAFHIGTMAGAGWIDDAPIYAALEDACRQNGLWREDGATQCRKSIRSGLRKGRLKPRGPLEDRQYDPPTVSDEEAATYDTRGHLTKLKEALARKSPSAAHESAVDTPKEDWTDEGSYSIQNSSAALAGEIRPIPELFSVGAKDGLLPFPDELTRVDGLMGEIIEWLLANNLTPNRTSALVIAMGVMVNFTARHFVGPSEQGTGLHMYLAFLGGTGSGKASIQRWIRWITDSVCDNPSLAVKNLGVANKFKSRIKPGRYTSASTLEKHIRAGGAASMLYMDELGDIITSFNGPRASEHMKGISNILMELWGVNTAKYESQAYVADVGNNKDTTIMHPAVSIIGLSTHDKFWSAFSGIDIKSGFANRFMIIQMPNSSKRKDENEEVKPYQKRKPILSESISGKLHDIIVWGTEKLPIDKRTSDVQDYANPICIDWGDGQLAIRAYNQHFNMVHDCIENHPETDEYIRRAPEQAVRLATLLAISNGREFLTRDDMIWGISIANYSAQALYSGARAHMAASQHEALVNRIIHLLGKKGPKGLISRSEIQANNRKYRPREITEALESAIDANWIADRTSPTEKKKAEAKNTKVCRMYGRGPEWPGCD